MGLVAAFNDFAGRLFHVEELKHEALTKEAIMALKSLMRGRRIGRNSSGNSKISGSLSGRILKTSIYGNERKSAADLGIWEIKKAICDFPRQVENGKNWKEKQYREKKKAIIGNVGEVENSG